MLPLKPIVPVDDIVPDYDYVERLGAAHSLGNTDTFVENYLRDGYLDELQGMKAPEGFGDITPEEANKLFPNVEKPFSKPIPYFVAQELDTVGKERKKLNDVINNRGRGSWGGNLAISMAGGAIAHATDPIEAGADILMSLGTGGVGLLLSKVNKARNSAKIATMANMLQSNTFTKSLVEGTIANTALEGQNYKSSTRAQFDYGMQDAITSIVGGGILFPSVLHGTMKGVPAAYKYMRNKYEANGMAFKANVGNFFENKMPGSQAIQKYYHSLFNNRDLAPADSLRAKYTFSPIDSDEALKNTKFYASSRGSLKDLDVDEVDMHTFDTDFGDGLVHMVSDPNPAYNIAGDHLSDSLGEVHEFNISTSKIIDADSAIDSDFGKQISEVITDPKMKEIYDSSPTIREAFDDIRDYLEATGEDLSKLNDITSRVKELGVDGFRYTIRNEVGTPTSHGLAMFKGEGKKEYSQAYKVDRKQVPSLNDKDATNFAKQTMSKENDVDYNSALEKEAADIKTQSEPVDVELKAQNEARLKEIDEVLSIYEKSDNITPDQQAALKAIRELSSEEVLESDIMEDYIACLIGSIDE